MKADAEQRWKTYMTSLGQKFEKFSWMIKKDKKRLFQALKTNHEYRCRGTEENQCFQDIQQRCGDNDMVAHHGNIDQINKNEEQVVESIVHIAKTAGHLHEQMKNEIQESQKKVDLLNENIETQNRKFQKSLRVEWLYRRHVGRKLKQINTLLDSMEKLEELVELGSQTIEKWHISMQKIEEDAKALAINPFNFQINAYHQMMEECLTIMSQQKDKVSSYEQRLINHTKGRSKFLENMDQINKWISSMPCDTVQLFKEAQHNMRSQIEWSSKKVSNICEKIDCGQKDVEELDGKIKGLRNKMAGIESMTENPRLFAIEWVTPENITHVFSELERWNEIYGSLKETVHLWDEKTKEVEENMMQWETIVHKKSDDKFGDSSEKAGLSVL